MIFGDMLRGKNASYDAGNAVYVCIRYDVPRALSIKIRAFHSEDGGSRLLRNIGAVLSNTRRHVPCDCSLNILIIYVALEVRNNTWVICKEWKNVAVLN
jgi:hypothetical protein